MTITITFAKVRRVVDEIIAEVGNDFQYFDTENCNPDSGCVYVHPKYPVDGVEDTPGCLVGRILFKLGVPLSVMRENNWDTGSNSLLDKLVCRETIKFDDNSNEGFIRRYLNELQSSQDNQATWAGARRTADYWHESRVISDAIAWGEISPKMLEDCDCHACRMKTAPGK